MGHMKQYGRPPAKQQKGPFNVFPDVPAEDSSADDIIVPGPYHLWGSPGVPQPVRVKLLRPNQPGLGHVILPKNIPKVSPRAPVVVRPWNPPPTTVRPWTSPQDLHTAEVVDGCIRNLQNFFNPMYETLNRMVAVNENMYRDNRLMAYKMGQHNIVLPDLQTPVSQQDPYTNDDYTHPEASGSGGSGQIPVVMIDEPERKKGKRLRFKQPDQTKEDDKDGKDDKDGTSSKKSDKDGKDKKTDDDKKPDDKK